MESLYQLSIHSYYADEPAAGLRACEKMLRMDLDWNREMSVRNNRTWYTPFLHELVSAASARIELPPPHPGWTLFNPSILATQNGWLINLRSSNYRIKDWQYVIPPNDGHLIRTENMLVAYDDELNCLNVMNVKPSYAKTDHYADGLEDIRLNRTPVGVRISSTLRNMAPHDGTCRIGIGLLQGDGTIEDLRVPPSVSTINEKNWMPLLGRDEWIYSCSYQGHVATVKLWNNRWRITQRAKSPALAKGFRGGSQYIPLPHQSHLWLGVIHEVAINSNHRVYEHRFVLLDESKDFEIVKVSLPFVFQKKIGIEFCAGLAEKNGHLMLTYGVHDEEAWLSRVELEAVLKTLVDP